MSEIALTTVFTPPASCLDNSFTLYGANVYVKDVKVESTECYPSGFRAIWSKNLPFSPGQCPLNYAVASSTTSYGNKDITAALCCPASMTAHGGGELGCFTHVDSPTSLALPTGGTIVQDVMLGVHGVFVAWASSDSLVRHSTAAIATPASISASLTTTISPSSSSTSTGTSPSPSRTTSERPHLTSSNAAEANSTPHLTTDPIPKLTPSVVIGISAGAVAGALVLVGLTALAVLCRRRQRRRLSNENLEVRVFDSATDFYDDKRRWSVGSSDATGVGGVAEADSRPVVGGRAELEGD